MIVTDVGGLPSLQSDKSFVVPPDDAPRLAEVIRRVMTDPGEMAKLKRLTEEAAAAHTWDEVARRTIEVYRDVLSSSRPQFADHAGLSEDASLLEKAPSLERFQRDEKIKEA